MLPAAALLLLAWTPATSVAVVDLSTTPQVAFLDALRRVPGIKGRTLPAARTQAVVADAEGLGLHCRITNDGCLEKLMVLLRADELVAFAFERGSVKLVRMDAAGTTRARVKFSAPATTAQAAMAALEAAAGAAVTAVSPPPLPSSAAPEEVAAPTPVSNEEPPTTTTLPPKTAGPPSTAEPTRPRRTPATPDAPKAPAGGAHEEAGASPALAIGIVGGGLGVGCGAVAVAVSLDLAQQQLDAKNPDLRRPIDGGAYDRGVLTFGALTTCAVAGLVTAGIGAGLFLSEGASSDR